VTVSRIKKQPPPGASPDRGALRFPLSEGVGGVPSYILHQFVSPSPDEPVLITSVALVPGIAKLPL